MKNRLKEVMHEKSINQKELALRTGYTEAHISRYATGKRKGSVVAWALIADALGVSMDDLIVHDDYCNICKRRKDEICARCEHGQN